MAQAGEAQKRLLRVLRDPDATLVDAARAYKKMIRNRKAHFDWPEINEAIIDRWSEAGMTRIRELAWDPQAI